MAQHRDSSTVWLDLAERDPARRFKMSLWHDHYLLLFVSRRRHPLERVGRSGPAGDRTTFFYNPFRKVWVFSLRDEGVERRGPRIGGTGRRPISTAAHAGARTSRCRGSAADVDDPRRPEYNVPAELYNLDCVAYESLMLGLFTIWRGERTDREKPNDVCVGFSRDGFHWDRPDRRAFLPVSEHVGDWNWANVQSAGGCCLVVGDQLYFYVSGRRGVPGTERSRRLQHRPGDAPPRRVRLDGPRARPPSGIERIDPSIEPGTLTTRPVRFSGRHLFVNVDAPAGELRVEVLDREARPIPRFSAAQCVPVTGDRRDGARHLDRRAATCRRSPARPSASASA